MTQQAQRQKPPSNWAAREALREKGQFWTPQWAAEAMIAYCLADGAESIFDPSGPEPSLSPQRKWPEKNAVR
jgi:hypothetical protein